ncbi:undecaprenyldiphospho-muramoylpentapeptide beta-N-acetylglucosaminyltransferase [Fastidiosibacter lacustris]|uniref:undecaprenyldiphospho-muramoylpentapeptide beta-N-acetylglucosaminyltransferase n=1 Tax=Fastidiosibacter lacustris TaxID=2056695 RepID=UPI000E355FFB|nr:undecaprenyldiphospho-muramoylpentapeptide beta-N-acetylglucosaminyltransferase [Fastidiosibacter lacustris]
MQQQTDVVSGKNIVVMAGGTGGHIFPALAVAKHLSEQGANIFWFGTQYGLEKKIVANQYPLDFLKIGGVRNKGLKKKLLFSFQLSLAVLRAMIILRRRKTNCVLGFGGYASGPGGIAAKLLNIPLIIHEQNANPGMTNKMLAKFAKKVLCAFPTSGFKTKSIVEVIGNPIRSEIRNLHNQSRDFYKHILNVLVLGGSQGAKVLNDVVPKFIKALPREACVNIWHQTGEKGFAETMSTYQALNIDYKCELKVEPFINDMAQAYQWADIIVCRAGALTVSEIASVGVPAFFVPFAEAVDDHQYHNAQFLVQAEAAICMREEHFNAQKLAAFIRAMDINRSKLENMSSHAKGVAKLDAVEKLVDEVKKLI